MNHACQLVLHENRGLEKLGNFEGLEGCSPLGIIL